MLNNKPLAFSLPWAKCSDNAALAGRIEIENIYIVFQKLLNLFRLKTVRTSFQI